MISCRRCQCQSPFPNYENFLFLSPRYFYPKNGLLFEMPTWLTNVKTLQWRQKITSTYWSTYTDYLHVLDQLSSHYHEIYKITHYVHRTAGENLSYWAFELSVSSNSTVDVLYFLDFLNKNFKLENSPKKVRTLIGLSAYDPKNKSFQKYTPLKGFSK